MENVATSVRIPGDASGILSALSSKLGQPKAQVVERALKDLHERIFWADVAEAFDRTASDNEDNTRQAAETALWERISEADFREEQW